MKINSNLNKNYYAQQKHPTFGVKKTDHVQSFINEIKTTNPNLGDIERLPIVQKMKESDTFEQLQKKANVDKSMFENKRSFNIANEKGFTTFINSICIKIMNELRQLGKTVKKFIVQIEDENGNKKKNDIINAFKKRLSVKASHENNPEKRKEDNRKYYEDNKDEILEKHKEYRQNNSEKIRKKQKEYRQNNSEKISKKQKEYNKKYYEKNKDKISEKRKKSRQNKPKKLKINVMSPETQHEEMQSKLMPQISLPQEYEDFGSMLPNFQQEQEDFELKPKTSWEQGQKDFETILPNFQQDPEDDFIL